MKKRILNCVLAALALMVLYRPGVWVLKNQFTAATSRTLNTPHFSVYYRRTSPWDAEAVANRLEANYGRILRDLGIPAHPRVHVYIHPTRESFVQAVGFYAMGVIRGVDTLHLLKPVSLLADVVAPMDKVAVHEFVHAVTIHRLMAEARRRGRVRSRADFEKLYARDGKRFDQVYPRWLWESVAVYEAGQYNALVANLTVKNGFPTLAQLNEHNNLVYNLGYTVLDYIIRVHGKEKLMELLHADGDTEGVLGLTPAAFEKEWAAFVREEYWIFMGG